MIRLMNICVIAALVLAATHVYRIKFESTRQAERLAKLRTEVRNEREAIATLRAEWSRLDNPARIQGLAARHLALKPIEPRQFDSLEHLPERAPESPPADASDPIETLIEQAQISELPTSSVSSTQGSKQPVR
jgi:cell division protein FtsL